MVPVKNTEYDLELYIEARYPLHSEHNGFYPVHMLGN